MTDQQHNAHLRRILAAIALIVCRVVLLPVPCAMMSGCGMHARQQIIPEAQKRAVAAACTLSSLARARDPAPALLRCLR